MTTEQRAEMRKAFEHALQCIKAESVGFICVTMRRDHPARELVMQRLGGAYTLEDWLTKVCGVTDDELEANPDKVRATRIAWLESLIKEFS